MPKISVIVPVYNSSKYLSKCIDSILFQSETDFELLLIDDGSTDGSEIICDNYAKKDARVNVIHKSNGGVSTARNIGLDNARGKMIFFIDSDDTVEKDYLKEGMIQEDEDFVQSGVTTLENEYLKPIMTHEDIFADFNRFWMESRQHWAPLCCLSKKIIDENNLRFDSALKMGEDMFFNQIFLSKCKKIRRIKYSGYNYNYENVGSASHKFYPDRLDQQIHLIYELEKYFSNDDLWRIRWDFWNEVINHYVVKGVSNKDKEVRKTAKKKLKETYKTNAFRKCIPYIRSSGSLDEKLKSYFMGYYKNWMYTPALKFIQALLKITKRISQ